MIFFFIVTCERNEHVLRVYFFNFYLNRERRAIQLHKQDYPWDLRGLLSTHLKKKKNM